MDLKKRIFKHKHNFLVAIVSYFIGVFYNRGLTFNLHSEGLIYNEQAEKLLIDGLINPYPQRILTPLIASIFNLSTQHINLIFLFIFLLIFTIYINNLPFITKFILTCSISTTMPIIFSMNFGGYPDIVSYTIFLLILMFNQKKHLPFILFLLLLLSREAFIVYFPFFVLFKSLNDKNKFTFNFCGYLIATFVYLVYYYVSFKIAAGTSGEVWDYSFYLGPLKSNLFFWLENYSLNYFIGVFSSLKFLTFLLPIIFLRMNFRQKWLFILFIVLTMSTSLVCGDISRCFSPLLFCIILFPEILNFKSLNFTIFILFVLNIFSPKYYVWHGGKLNYLNDSRIHFLDIMKIFN